MQSQAAEVRPVNDTEHYAAKCREYARLLGIANAKLGAFQLRHDVDQRIIAGLKQRIEEYDRDLAYADCRAEEAMAALAWEQRYETRETD